ncbi:c-type cytochrome [Maribellus mangrovi]|uniref:c-type cytochrome n=1 Tax=Maribellus mangrovi TaxID=3133146 RepID=UPI0030ED2424
MKKFTFLFVFGVLALALLNSSCTNNSSTKDKGAEKVLSEAELVKHGEYLVKSMGCHDCHSPKTMGPNGPEIIPELMLSGFQANYPPMVTDTSLTNKGYGIFNPDLTAAAGPWGVSYAANLTPDVTGIGTWTEEQFKRALTEGKFKGIEGSRMLLPPMPWFNFTELKDEDVKAIFLYLKSIPPIRNVVPAPVAPENM